MVRTRMPSLFKREAGAAWHRMTRAWWRDVWHSPMASQYVQADIHGLYRLAVLIDQFWSDPTKELAAEIRLQQQAFGLSPIDRRRLEWSIEEVEGANTKRRQRAVETATDVLDDARLVLLQDAGAGSAIAA